MAVKMKYVNLEDIWSFHGDGSLHVDIFGLYIIILEVLTNIAEELTTFIFRVEVSRLANRKLCRKSGVEPIPHFW